MVLQDYVCLFQARSTLVIQNHHMFSDNTKSLHYRRTGTRFLKELSYLCSVLGTEVSDPRKRIHLSPSDVCRTL